jgi:transient receptor potential cation channel subfamily M protein 3
MMYRMVKNLLYFIVLILMVLVSFGVCNQSIEYPNEEWDWRKVTDFCLIPVITGYQISTRYHLW